MTYVRLIVNSYFQDGPRSSIWKKDYDKTRKFRDEWLEKYPWVERDPDGDRYGYCPHCNIKLEPKAKRLEDHERTVKHMKNSGVKFSGQRKVSGKMFRGRKRRFRRVSLLSFHLNVISVIVVTVVHFYKALVVTLSRSNKEG